MNPNLFHMLVFAGRKARIRVCAITAGIAVGMAGLLLMVGAFNGLQNRDSREAWLDAKGHTASATTTPSNHQALVLHKTDRFREKTIDVLLVATGDQSAIAIPGVSHAPTPGTYVPSPALAKLIDSNGDAQLGQRYGIHRDGVLPPTVLASPDSLTALVGADAKALAASGNAELVSSFDVSRPSQLSANDAVRTIVALGAIGLLLPVMLLVSVVTQLGLSERQEALSTLRLIGAPPSIIGRIAVLEAALTAVAGSVLGVALAALARPLAARIAVDKGSFFPSDLALEPPAIAVCCLILIAAVIAAASRRAHKARIGPTGVSRQEAERAPTFSRVMPLAAGIVIMGLLPVGLRGGWIAEGVPASLTMITGFLAISLGIMSAGPYVTHLAGALAAQRTGSAAGLIASGRIKAAPRATFRSVSGLVVATFMVSVFAVAASAGAPERAEEGPGKLPLDALIMQLAGHRDPAPALAALSEVPGVRGAAVAYGTRPQTDRQGEMSPDALIVTSTDAASVGLTPTDVSAAYQAFNAAAYVSAMADQAARPTATSAAAVGEPAALIVRTDGSDTNRERVRTAMEVAWPYGDPPQTRVELAGNGNQIIAQLYSIANAGILIAIAIAGCTLAISTAAAMVERRRILGMLRLMGTPANSIRRAVAYEATIPLAVTLIASVGLGLGVAWFIVLSLSSSAQPSTPSPQYFLALGSGLVVAVAIIAASLFAVRPTSNSDATRFE